MLNIIMVSVTVSFYGTLKLSLFLYCSIQAGKYHEALELLKTALKIEEKELGARRHRMVELYALMAEIYDEVSLESVLK